MDCSIHQLHERSLHPLSPCLKRKTGCGLQVQAIVAETSDIAAALEASVAASHLVSANGNPPHAQGRLKVVGLGTRGVTALRGLSGACSRTGLELTLSVINCQ